MILTWGIKTEGLYFLVSISKYRKWKHNGSDDPASHTRIHHKVNIHHEFEERKKEISKVCWISVKYLNHSIQIY